jgi:hypothetical protein
MCVCGLRLGKGKKGKGKGKKGKGKGKKGKGKGKAVPSQTWTGPEGSRRLRLPDFKRVGT